MIEFLRKLFVYDKWAIDRSIGTLNGPASERALTMLSHILHAENIWLTRLNGKDSSHIAVFEQLSLAECKQLSDQVHAAYTAYLDTLTDADLALVITYKNIAGVEYRSPVGEILTHVGLHGVYHRGQIALMVRDAGGEAIGTDYILFTRL